MFRNNTGRQKLLNSLKNILNDKAIETQEIKNCIQYLQNELEHGSSDKIAFGEPAGLLEEKDHQALVMFLINNDEMGISSYRETLGYLLSKEYFNETSIKNSLCFALQEAILRNKLSLVNKISSIYTFKPQDLNTWQYKGDGRIKGATLLQLSILQGKGNLEIFEILRHLNADINVTDLYANNCLHYAARLANQDVYNYISSLNPQLEKEKNALGYLPSNYSPGNAPAIMAQNKLTEAFSKYLNLKYPDNVNEMAQEMKSGLCFADSPLIGIHILRGKNAMDKFYHHREMMIKFDGSQASLVKPFEDQQLFQMGFKNLTDVFEYYIQLYTYLFNLQNKNSVISFSQSDRPEHLDFINTDEDGIYSVCDYSDVHIDKNELYNLLEYHISNKNTNIIFDLFLVEDKRNVILGPGHNASIVIKDENEIYLCEPNAAHKPLPLTFNEIKKIMPLLYSYFNNIQKVAIYQYTADKNLTYNPTQSNYYATFFEKMNTNKVYALEVACILDAKFTLEKLLSPSSNAPVMLSKIELNKLISSASRYGSYQCLELIMNLFKDQVEIDKVMSKDEQDRFNSYIHNRYKL